MQVTVCDHETQKLGNLGTSRTCSLSLLQGKWAHKTRSQIYFNVNRQFVFINKCSFAINLVDTNKYVREGNRVGGYK